MERVPSLVGRKEDGRGVEGSVGAVQAGMVVDLIRGEGTVVDGNIVNDTIEII